MIRFTLVLAVALLSAGCATRTGPPPPVISEIKRLESELGLSPSGNFSRSSARRDAFYRCYYTGLLTLPDSYEELKVKDGAATGCRIDESRYDVFFYPIEAVSTGDVAVTPSLAEAAPERVSMVVPHEDFHDDPAIRKLPDRIAEAAATLVGFLTAAEFARRRHGEASPEFARLNGEAELYLRKAAVVNSYHERLQRLYRSAPRAEALARKRILFSSLETQCAALRPDPATFAKCPGAANNAGLAFDVTYTRYYPEIHALHTALGRDLRTTIRSLRGIGARRPRTERDALQLLAAARR